MTSNLEDFGLAEMLRTGLGLRRAMRDARTLESGADRACRFLYDHLVAADGGRACVLVRSYKTHAFGALDPSLRAFARRALPSDFAPKEDMRCLTLLASRGDEPAWNDRRDSEGHQAIPLAAASMVERAPMIAGLIRAFGLNIAHVVEPPHEAVRDLEGKSYGVFFVEEAEKSIYIPAQDFVRRYGVRSVVGFGGALAGGDLFAMILFTRVRMNAVSADRFRNIALDVKSLLFGYGANAIFDPAARSRPTVDV